MAGWGPANGLGFGASPAPPWEGGEGDGAGFCSGRCGAVRCGRGGGGKKAAEDGWLRMPLPADVLGRVPIIAHMNFLPGPPSRVNWLSPPLPRPAHARRDGLHPFPPPTIVTAPHSPAPSPPPHTAPVAPHSPLGWGASAASRSSPSSARPATPFPAYALGCSNSSPWYRVDLHPSPPPSGWTGYACRGRAPPCLRRRLRLRLVQRSHEGRKVSSGADRQPLRPDDLRRSAQHRHHLLRVGLAGAAVPLHHLGRHAAVGVAAAAGARRRRAVLVIIVLHGWSRCAPAAPGTV